MHISVHTIREGLITSQGRMEFAFPITHDNKQVQELLTTFLMEGNKLENIGDSHKINDKTSITLIRQQSDDRFYYIAVDEEMLLHLFLYDIEYNGDDESPTMAIQLVIASYSKPIPIQTICQKLQEIHITCDAETILHSVEKDKYVEIPGDDLFKVSIFLNNKEPLPVSRHIKSSILVSLLKGETPTPTYEVIIQFDRKDGLPLEEGENTLTKEYIEPLYKLLKKAQFA